MRRPFRELDGRLLAAAMVIVYLAALGSIDLATGSTPWTRVGVSAHRTSFEDMASITSSWTCERRGIEAFPNNPCDPLGRPANYPRLWTKLGFLGLGTGDTTKLGVAQALVFFAAALLIAGRLTLDEGALYGALLIAPATMLGVERGNIDLAMFALVALGVALVRRSPWAGAAPIVLAGILKLFPALGLAMLLRERRRWAALGASLAVLAVYAAATFSDIRTLRAVIPRDYRNSFGASVIPFSLHAHAVSWAKTSSEIRDLRVLILAGGTVLAALLVLAGRGGSAPADTRRLDGFWAGAAIYLGTYLFGNNYDYRLVFLLLCVPQLLAWARNDDAPVPWPAAAAGAILVTFWLSTVEPVLPSSLATWYTGLAVEPDDVLNWLLFAWLGAALASPGLEFLRGRRVARPV